MPAPDNPWIARLLEMRCGANRLRKLEIKILPVPCMTSHTAIEFLENAARLNSLLKSVIEKGDETHRRTYWRKNRDVPSGTALHS